MDFTRAGVLKRGILLFWSLWTSLVVVTNVFGLLKALGILARSFPLSSGNYMLLARTTGVYGTPAWVDQVLLILVILWELGCAVLFWRGLLRFASGRPGRWRAVYLAFAALLALFAVFILSDEIFRAYRIEGSHRGIATLLLASLLALQLLPDEAPADA
ncbi:MAG: hypothetical protein ACRDFS_06005 [Chloroflexota bacterium]